MPDEAVALGLRVIVATTFQTTLTPAKEIVQYAAETTGKPIGLIDILFDTTRTEFKTDDPEGYETEIINN